QYPFERRLGRQLDVAEARAAAPVVLRIDASVVRAGARDLLHDVHLTLGRADRVRVFGPNGAGKSTLLGALLDAATMPRDRILHLPQELSGAEGAACLDDVRRLPAETRGGLLTILAGLGVDPDRLLASRRPSPGGARKLLLAHGRAPQGRA